jgi:hypothetical protein
MRPFCFRSLSTRRNHGCIPTSLCLAHSRVDEHAFGLDGDAVGVGNVADGERLYPFHTIYLCLRVQLPKASAP